MAASVISQEALYIPELFSFHSAGGMFHMDTHRIDRQVAYWRVSGRELHMKNQAPLFMLQALRTLAPGGWNGPWSPASLICYPSCFGQN